MDSTELMERIEKMVLRHGAAPVVITYGGAEAWIQLLEIEDVIWLDGMGEVAIVGREPEEEEG